jgi:uncharacterized protein
MISLLELFIYAGIGIVAGFTSGLLGVGGGIIVVPSLLVCFYLIGFPEESLMQRAIGTSLAAMIFTAGASAWSHWKYVNWSIFKALVPGILLGAFLGALIAHWLPTKLLQVIFGLFLCLFGIYFLWTAAIKEFKREIEPHFVIINILGLFIGALSSILGLGGGIVTVPALTILGIAMKNAISTSALTGFFIALMGTFSFLYFGLKQETAESAGYIYIPAFIIIGLAAAAMAPIGARFAHKTSTVILKRVFGVYQLCVGVLLIWF